MPKITQKEFDLLVFIGRFQPLHSEHVRIINTALQKANQVLLLVGSSHRARSPRNPWSYGERLRMIQAQYITETHYGYLLVEPLRDCTYNDDKWVKQVQELISKHSTDTMKVGLIGASKDSSSYYLKKFPQLGSVNVEILKNINATNIREEFFNLSTVNNLFVDSYTDLTTDVKLVMKSMWGDTLIDTFSSPTYKNIEKEMECARNYKQLWANSPFPVKHNTVDSVVVQSGHILLVKRRAYPGKGLWALPGGHLEIQETLEEGALRELKEETSIKLSDETLRRCIVNSKTFDDPYRSSIGRVITTAFYIKLRDEEKLTKVKAADDACAVKWLPLANLNDEELFDDHAAIIRYFLGI